MKETHLIEKGTSLKMAPRVKRLWKREMDRMYEKKEWWGAGQTIFSDKADDTAQKPLIIRKAIAFEKVLREMPISIGEDELIVGNMIMSSSGLGRFFPDYATLKEKEAAARKSLSIRSVWGHSVPDYSKVINMGLAGIKVEAKLSLEKLGHENGRNERKRHFLESVLMCCDAVRDFCHRYAHLTDALAQKEKDIYRKRELEKIARVCGNVSENPAGSFHEALQSFWFVHVVFHNTLDWVPIGRFDQYMYPFYKKDMREGRITRDQAQELLDCLWIKFSERVQIKKEHFEDHRDPTDYSYGRDPQSNLSFPTIDDEAYVNQWLQTCVLGGQTADGVDATNEVTYMCLKATQKLQLTQPSVYVRFHKGSPQKLLRKCCEVISSGGGMPIILNDEAKLPHLQNVGIPLKEAREYCVSGCWEMEIPGKTELHWIPVHSLKCLEWVFNRGYNSVDGKKQGIDTGDIATFESFDQVMNAFKLQLENLILTNFNETIKWYGSNYAIAPVPFLSSMIEGCMENAQDLTQGAAKYIFYPVYLTGLPNTVDSLISVKKLVFEEKEVTLRQIKEALDNNFYGYEDLRQRMLNNVPKYGNDDNSADQLAVDIAEYFANKVKEHTTSYPAIKFPVAIGTTPLYLVFGRMVGATPDGRKAKTALATNFSPVCGVGKKGITGVIKSFTKVNFSKLGLDAELDVSISPNFVKGKEGILALMALVKTFMELGGTNLAVNVVSVETLRRAQKEPENFRNLRVRLSGWQAFFVALNVEHQETHISRIEHGFK